MRVRALGFVLVAFPGLVACPGELEDPARFESTANEPSGANTSTGTTQAACNVTPIFDAHCKGCHSGSAAAGSLALDRPLEGLRGEAAKGGPGLLIDPAAPDKSVLYTKLVAPPPFGATMPPSEKLSTGDLECVRSWLTSLAGDGGR